MTPNELLEKMRAKVDIISSKEDLGVLNAEIRRDKAPEVMEFMRTGLGFDWMSYMTCLDWPANNIIEAVYELFSNANKDRCVIRIKLDRQNPELMSVCKTYRTAEWHEREAAEMFGIKLTGHPDPRKLLLTEDINAPLRKDFSHPEMKKLPV